MAQDKIVENCPLCGGDGYIDHGDIDGAAYVVCCECSLPYKVSRGEEWRQTISEALEMGRIDVLRSLCFEDLDPDEIAADWRDWKAEHAA